MLDEIKVLEKYDDFLKLLSKCKCAEVNRKELWSKRLPITRFEPNEKDTKKWNKILDELWWFIENGYCKPAVLTETGNICKARDKYNYFSYYLDLTYKYAVDLYIIADDKYRLQYGFVKDSAVTLSGNQAFMKFMKLCKKFNVPLEQFQVSKEDGEKIARRTGAGIRKILSEYNLNKELKHCYHIDFNSSFPYGLVRTHSEFKEVVEHIYNRKRYGEYKERVECKAILNYAIGYMHSDSCQYRFAGIAKDSIDDNDKRILQLEKMLNDNGYLPLAINIDGIWYQDLYGQGEFLTNIHGDELGQLKTDYKDVTCIFKSAGCYQFKTKEGVVYSKVQGLTKLDAMKPRDRNGLGWDWLDIYKFKNAISYKVDLQGKVELYG